MNCRCSAARWRCRPTRPIAPRCSTTRATSSAFPTPTAPSSMRVRLEHGRRAPRVRRLGSQPVRRNEHQRYHSDRRAGLRSVLGRAAAHGGRLRPIQLLTTAREQLERTRRLDRRAPDGAAARRHPVGRRLRRHDRRAAAAAAGHARAGRSHHGCAARPCGDGGVVADGRRERLRRRRWKAERLRAIGAISALALAALNVATVWASGETVTLIRALAGVPSGILIWITIAMIARSPTPERWSGIYLTIQTLAQFVLAAALTAWVISRSRRERRIRRARRAVRRSAQSLRWRCRIASRRWSRTVTSSNCRTRAASSRWPRPFLWMAFIVGVWVYAEPLSRQAGHAPTVAGVAVSLSLACQVLGGATATAAGGTPAMVPGAHVLRADLCRVACSHSPRCRANRSTWLTSGVFGFLWMFSLPFFVPMVIAADPTRRAAAA